MKARNASRRFLHLAPALLALALLPALGAAPAFAGANVIIFNLDAGTGQGYDDPTPVAPEGGNPGTTLGQQRLIVAQFAADVWGSILDSPAPIFVLATFQPLPCTATGAVLGSAGTTFIFANFPPGPPTVRPDTWYHSALADQLAGFDLNPGFGDILSRFNSSIGTDPGCLTGRRFYYGLDNNEGNNIDFLSVVLHEIAHGLGFANFVNEATGANLAGRTDIYAVFSFDNTLGLHWSDMDDAQRQFSAVNDGNVVWDGTAVTARTSQFLGNVPVLDVLTPALGSFDVQPASFGPPLTVAGVTGSVVLADDGVGAASDGCERFTNRVRGAIALIDRGGCTFVTKVANAQAAGAIAAIVANNQPGGPTPMGGTSDAIDIPSVGITLDQGNALKAELPDLVVRIGLDPARLVGADTANRAKLYAPPVVALGSSISHWDVSATPNLLMEPAINTDLRSAATLDLTPWQMQDVGWTLADDDADGVLDAEDACTGSDLSATVMIDGCDSGVDNTFFADGCTIADLVGKCAATAANHGDFVSCVAQLNIGLRGNGILTGEDQGAIESCAAEAAIP